MLGNFNSFFVVSNLVFKIELEHIRWRAIANPHTLEEI